MAGRGRGRGRGFRVNSSAPMREPDPDTVARLVGSGSASGTGQYATGLLLINAPPGSNFSYWHWYPLVHSKSHIGAQT